MSFELFDKQKIAFDYLTDNKTETIFYGGAAGGAKTTLGCYWMGMLLYYVPGAKAFIGRDNIKDTKESVIYTWNEVLRDKIRFKDYKINDQIIFKNGSTVDFLDLSYMPNKDPNFDRLGSKEYTIGWIEEAQQTKEKAFDICNTRVGRWKNKEFNIKQKLLVTFNPGKGWLYNNVWIPFKNNSLPENQKFIRSLCTDNPHLTDDYIEKLRNIKDKSTRERLFYGNFDYDDDPDKLIDTDLIENHFDHIMVDVKAPKYLVADIARLGSDRAIITVWQGFSIIEYHIFEKSLLTDIQRCINAMRIKHYIPAGRCIADEDGIGSGIIDNCKILGFINNRRANNKVYYNLKSECGFKLAEIFDKIYFAADIGNEMKQNIKDELECLKTHDSDTEGRLRIIPKEIIKEKIKRSPDWLDVYIMRMYWEVSNISTFIVRSS
jgi:hypothetical protein